MVAQQGREQNALTVLARFTERCRAARACRHPGEPGQQIPSVRLPRARDHRLRRVLIFGLALRSSSKPPASTRSSTTADHFAQAGGGLSTAFGQSVFVGLVNVGMTFVAIWLIDRLGASRCCASGGRHDVVTTYDQLGVLHSPCVGWRRAGRQSRHGRIGCHRRIRRSFAISLGP